MIEFRNRDADAGTARERPFDLSYTGDADRETETKCAGDSQVSKDGDIVLNVIEHGVTFGTQN
jgi:uncharacterized membrane protein